jgi:hypothetical protein
LLNGHSLKNGINLTRERILTKTTGVSFRVSILDALKFQRIVLHLEQKKVETIKVADI